MPTFLGAMLAPSKANPATAKAQSARIAKRTAAEVPITHQNMGMTIKKIGVRGTLIKSKPAVRIVVGQGTAKTGTLGYWGNPSKATAGYAIAYKASDAPRMVHTSETAVRYRKRFLLNPNHTNKHPSVKKRIANSLAAGLTRAKNMP